MTTISPNSRVVITVGSIAGFFLAMVAVFIVPAVLNKIESWDNNHLESKLTDVRQDSDIRHNAKSIDDMTLAFKEFVKAMDDLKDDTSQIKIGQATLFEKLDSWEPVPRRDK